MTSTVVSGSNSSNIMNMVGPKQTQGQVGNGEFKNLLQKTEDGSLDTNDLKTEKVTKKSEVKKEAKEEQVKTDKTENVTKAETVERPETKEAEREVTKEEVDTVKEAVETVKEEIKEELDVTDEAIIAALEALQLTPVALLDKDILPQVVTYLTGSDDILAITMDENLYESLNNIETEVDTEVKALTEELDIDISEFSEALKEVEKPVVAEGKPEIKGETETANETVIETEDKELVSNDTFKVVERYEARSFESKITVNVSDDSNKNVTETKAYVAGSFETKADVTSNSKSLINSEGLKETSGDVLLTEELKEVFKETGKENGSENPGNFSGNFFNFAQNLLSKTVEAMNETEAASGYTSFDVENIMNQLTEGIDVNITPETSEINLRLHPESLGSVSVKVTANNEGVLTARFTASNESVKAIIESQALVLRETLENKGVTVEAVEVVVQTHQFERNLSDQNRGNGESNEPKKRGVRRINLSEGIEEEISEGDELVKEMMAQNGNSIDYSA